MCTICFNTRNSAFCPNCVSCVLYIWHTEGRLLTVHEINRSIFLADMNCVLCEVGIGLLNMYKRIACLKGYGVAGPSVTAPVCGLGVTGIVQPTAHNVAAVTYIFAMVTRPTCSAIIGHLQGEFFTQMDCSCSGQFFVSYFFCICNIFIIFLFI
jgi:hypothetical protein